jgi:uncharacterized protein with HEPN domain
MSDKKKFTKDRLEHIMQAIEEIDMNIKACTKRSFLENRLLIHAVLYQYAVIGEAVRKIDPDLLVKYDYPWHLVRSFRNFILHEYHAIEYRIVWDTSVNDLPELKKIILEIIKNEF